MTTEEDAEVVRELTGELPAGWQWRPHLVEDSEALRLLERYAERGLPETAREEVLRSASDIIARGAPPSREIDSQETGLVVGYVQSGKTLSFTTVAALACDNQFPLVVVLSGTKKNLYSQTVKRLQRDLQLDQPAGRWTLFEVQTRNPDLSQQLENLLETWDQPVLRGFPRKTALITVLKNSRRIDGLVNALSALSLRGRPCLIIDDEADQFGLNTRVREGELSSTYRALLALRSVIPQHTYIQYTATPQALLLINVLDSLSPRFGCVLSKGEGYCGGREFFEDEEVRLVRTIPDGDFHAMEDNTDNGPPDSLLNAMCLFYVGVAMQAIRRGRRENTQQYRSMLVHPSMHRIDHFRYKTWIEWATRSWIELLSLPPGTLDRDELVHDFQAAYDDLARTTEICQVRNEYHEAIPEFDEVLEYLPQAMLNTHSREVNSRVLEQWTQDNWNSAHSHILVGGENLGRGFTVEGLTTTYMPRGRGGGVADTIQQRGRFFGYKKEYMGLCRVFLPFEVRSDYENYIEHESFVMEKLRQLSHSGSPMSGWRRQMLLAQSLQPTRRSVMPDIYRHLRVSPWTAQSQPWLPAEGSDPDVNWSIIESFLEDFDFFEDPGSEERTQEQRHELAEEVPLENVLTDLLVQMWFSRRDAPNFSAVELAIQLHLKSNPNATASVYRMAGSSRRLSGQGTRRRRISVNGRLSNLFQGAAPVEPAGRRGSVYPGDRQIHAVQEVTVQIHDLDLTDDSESPRLLRGHVPAVAVWVPEFMRAEIFEEMAS